MVNLDNIHNKVNFYHQNLVKLSYIRKLKNGKWRVFSEKGKNLGTFDTEKEAKKRLQQIHFFKYKKASSNSLSAVMRELNKEYGNDVALKFLALYKYAFDLLVCSKVKKVEDKAFLIASKLFFKIYQIKLEKIADLSGGNAQQVGKYLADIIKFTVSRISPERRPHSINRLKHKIYQLNENELANKKMPVSSSLGQAITFVKNVLFNHDARYIRDVLNYIVSFL